MKRITVHFTPFSGFIRQPGTAYTLCTWTWDAALAWDHSDTVLMDEAIRTAVGWWIHGTPEEIRTFCAITTVLDA